MDNVQHRYVGVNEFGGMVYASRHTPKSLWRVFFAYADDTHGIVYSVPTGAGNFLTTSLRDAARYAAAFSCWKHRTLNAIREHHHVVATEEV